MLPTVFLPWYNTKYISRIWIVHDKNLNESDRFYEKFVNGFFLKSQVRFTRWKLFSAMRDIHTKWR